MTQANIVYLAPEGFETPLEEELTLRGVSVVWRRGRLFGANGEGITPAWAQNIWYDPVLIPIRSIGDGVKKLRAVQRNWALVSTEHHRRAELIRQQLPPVGTKPFVFGSPPPAAPMGGWTLWDEGTILASAVCASSFANGEPRFAEDTQGPPSRAYRKLWEVFTVMGKRPQPGDLCLDLGSAPGGWTWVLAMLGARVFSLDKSPLDPAVAALPLVNHCENSSAFALDPVSAGAVDWLFCDVACYPDRLLRLVTRWLEKGRCGNFVCTIKFQGITDHSIASSFLNIPGSRLMHLAHNKHELTWTLFDNGTHS